MASTISKALFSLFLAATLTLFFSGVLGEITCEQLDQSTCAFSVSSSGLRCVLEKHVQGGGQEYSCRNSGVAAAGVGGWIETDECVKACGLHRDTVGLSSDYLIKRQFRRRLCSSECYDSCPNVVDLYANLAAGEGVSLSKLCQVMKNRREMNEINSSGEPNTETSVSPTGVPPPAVGRKLIGWISSPDWLASAPQTGRKVKGMNDAGEERAAAPV